MGIAKFFQNLFHCQTCEVLLSELEEYRKRFYELQNQPNAAVEILKVELENERLEKRKLLDKLLFPPEPKQDLDLEKEYKPVLPRHTPWHIQRAILEREDREKARVLAEFAEMEKKAKPVTTIAKLEEELLPAKDVSSVSGGVIAQIKPLTEDDFEVADAS